VCQGARADDFESLVALNSIVELTKDVRLTVQVRERNNHEWKDFYQFRVGPAVSWRFRPRATAIAGYFYLDQENTAKTIYGYHRAYGGAAYELYDGRRFGLEGRFLYERFFEVPRWGQYNRLRYRLAIASKRQQWAPYLTLEEMRGQDRWVAQCLTGLQWQLADRVKLRLGYEFRQQTSGPPSHVIGANFDLVLRRAHRE
jgi:hypothetical protein